MKDKRSRDCVLINTDHTLDPAAAAPNELDETLMGQKTVLLKQKSLLI